MSPRAALLCGLTMLAGLAIPVGAAAPTQGFAPTGHPMVLTRTVWRALADGREIRVSRRFRIEIERDGSGYAVRGRQIGVDVDAPAQIAMLAQVERARDESSLFPLRLDAGGRIVSGPPAGGSGARREGVAAAHAVIAARAPNPAAAREGIAFVDAVGGSGALNRWPDDLFRARPGERAESHPVALPDGGSGNVVVTIEAGAAMPCGVPTAVERRVSTRLGATTRVNRERWTFEML
ncbi:hypothetical protein ACOYW6_11135 [Parablastomonas sp. CN1-191]|uniref:hypothetical protein n=1 Tax=Parablastomonas sp. CN1-191 TaxID=3400908 RepID=UPI003BF875B6